MKRLYRLARMLSKFDQERLLDEHDQMSLMYLKNNIEHGELLEYHRSKVESKNNEWLGMMYVEDAKELSLFVKNEEFGRMIVGTTSFKVFQEIRKEYEEIDIILFKSVENPLLVFVTMVQELELLDEFQYIILCDASIKYDTLSLKDISKTNAVVFPHHIKPLKQFTGNKRHCKDDNSGESYYVSSFDTGFEMNTSTPTSYKIKCAVKYVKMNHIFASPIKTFKELTVAEYQFDKEGSLFYSLLHSGNCVMLTHPLHFSILI